MESPLDRVLPVYGFRERHDRLIHAPVNVVWDALMTVTARKLPISRILTGFRFAPAGLLRANAPSRSLDKPVIEAFLAGGFRLLHSEPPRLMVAGAAGQPWRLIRGEIADVHDLVGFQAFARPGFVLMCVSLELTPEGELTRLATETRVQPTDAASARAFRVYWLMIRAGSGLIRREFLREVARQTERENSTPDP